MSKVNDTKHNHNMSNDFCLSKMVSKEKAPFLRESQRAREDLFLYNLLAESFSCSTNVWANKVCAYMNAWKLQDPFH